MLTSISFVTFYELYMNRSALIESALILSSCAFYEHFYRRDDRP